MQSMLDNLKWAKGLESTHVDNAVEASSHIDIEDADVNDLSDTEDTETLSRTDGDDEVKVDTKKDITATESFEAGVISGDLGGKVIDATGFDANGAPKRFVISGFNAQTNPAAEAGDNLLSCVLLIQNGVIPEVGLNGITAEDLLKVIEEMYVCFQEGPFACEENEEILMHVRAAQAAIQKRLNRRLAEGTEGTLIGN